MKEGQDSEYDDGAQPGGKNIVYVLKLHDKDDQIADIVGVYSSEDLAKEGRKSDIEGWSKQPYRRDDPPEEKDYEIEEFTLDGDV